MNNDTKFQHLSNLVNSMDWPEGSLKLISFILNEVIAPSEFLINNLDALSLSMGDKDEVVLYFTVTHENVIQNEGLSRDDIVTVQDIISILRDYLLQAPLKLKESVKIMRPLELDEEDDPDCYRVQIIPFILKVKEFDFPAEGYENIRVE